MPLFAPMLLLGTLEQELSFVKYTINAFDAKILNSLECQFSAKECNMKLGAPKPLQSMMKKTYT